MAFFRIVIPNYNNGKWLRKSVGSVLEQTFSDYELIIVDDCSDDDSRDYLCSGEVRGRAQVFLSSIKRYNGGSRNVGMNQAEQKSEYTLFLDSDDWLVDKDVLQNLHDFIVAKDNPDCIRLPYKFEYDGNKSGQVPLIDNSPEMLVKSCFVACWTKCIKSELVQPFPENTLMEDVVQHIKQCDVIQNCVPFDKFVVLHNRNNLNSCTRKENIDSSKKWQSSMFRYMADLLDLELKHDYCEKVRQERVDACLKNIKNGIYSQSIIK